MALQDPVFIVGPIGSGCNTALNYLRGPEFEHGLVVPQLITAGPFEDLHDPRHQIQIPDEEFDQTIAAEGFRVVWSRPKIDIGKAAVRHAFYHISGDDTRLPVYGTNNSMFKSGNPRVEAFADTGRVLLINASWEIRRERLLNWLRDEKTVDKLMKWHEFNDDQFPMGYRPIKGVIDTTEATNKTEYLKIELDKFFKEKYAIVPG